MRNVSILMLFSALCASALDRLNGTCEQPNQQVVTQGVSSTTRVERTYASCTVSVYLAGTGTLASIFSDNSSTVLANPFTAATNGAWFFYAANGRYDVTLSGGGMAVPITLGDQVLLDIAGGFSVNGTVSIYNSSASDVDQMNVILIREPGSTVPYIRFRKNDANPDGASIGSDYSLNFQSLIDSSGNNGFALAYANNGLTFRDGQCIAWTATTTWSATKDVGLCRYGTDALVVSATGNPGNNKGILIAGALGITQDSGTQGVLSFFTNGVSKFAQYNDSDGNSFCITRYDDGGVAIDNPYCTFRATGNTAFLNTVGFASLFATGQVSFAAASSTFPAQVGTTLPATCQVGQQFYKSDAAAGQNLYGCTGVNAWSPQAGGGGTGYSTIMSQAASLTQRAIVNFQGSGISCSDNPGSSRTDCTVTGGGGGGGGFPVSDSTTLFFNNADPTKQATFNFAAISTGVGRTYQFPNADTMLAGLSIGQTYTGINTYTAGNTHSGANYFTNTNLFQANQAYQDVSGGSGSGISPIVIQNGTSTRWVIGSDTGHQNLSIVKYSDAGAPNGGVLTFSRASGTSTFGGPVSFGANIISNGTTGAAISAAARILVNSSDGLGMAITSTQNGLSITPGGGFPALALGGSITLASSSCCNIGTNAVPLNALVANSAFINPSGGTGVLLRMGPVGSPSFGAIGYFNTAAPTNTVLEVHRTFTGPSGIPSLYALSDSQSGVALWAIANGAGFSTAAIFSGTKYDIGLGPGVGLKGGTGAPSNPCDNSSMYFRADGGNGTRWYLCAGTVWQPVL